MSNEIQCYDENGNPKCHYYSIVRYGRLCSFDGTWSPVKKDCPNFIPLERISPRIQLDLKEEALKSCHRCIWRSYGGNNMMCDNQTAKQKMMDDPIFHTPCEFFELDETGDECYLREEEGYEFIKRERELRKSK